jgi:enoyl-CoA hydratase/carnithine racemase
VTTLPVPAGASVSCTLAPDTHVGTVELQRPPNNFLDIEVLRDVVTALSKLDQDPGCRAMVLCAAGKHFCAGRDFTAPRRPGDESASVYAEAGKLNDLRKPWIAAVQGAAIGAGFGLALCADFRICSPRAYFTANFVPLGLHAGFGTTVTLPRLIGAQRASELLYSGRKVSGSEAHELGLADRLADEDELRHQALDFAAKFADRPPLAVQAMRATMRAGLAEQFRHATEHEVKEQARLTRTADFREAAAAARERRPGRYTGT